MFLCKRHFKYVFCTEIGVTATLEIGTLAAPWPPTCSGRTVGGPATVRTPSDTLALRVTPGVLFKELSVELRLTVEGCPSERLLRRLPVLPSSLMSEDSRFIRNVCGKMLSLLDDGRLTALPVKAMLPSSLSLTSWIPLSVLSSVRVWRCVCVCVCVRCT